MVGARVVLLILAVIREISIEVFSAMRVDMVGGVRKSLPLFGMHIGHHRQIAEKQCHKRKKRHDYTSHRYAASRVSARFVQGAIVAALSEPAHVFSPAKY